MRDPAPGPWLREQRRALLAWARSAVHPYGFAWLDDDGAADREQGVQTWITARTTYTAALGLHHGDADARDTAAHGVRALYGPLYDGDHGGWFSRVSWDGSGDSGDKSAYEHAFVLLAAAAAKTAGVEGADGLFAEASRTVLAHFWDDTAGLSREGWDRSWRTPEAYRGANSNMHMVEAFLAAAAATGSTGWLQRAMRIAEFLIGEQAAVHGYRLPEHYSPEWHVLPEYNRDRPGDPFRPYGWTPGHSLEWARLLLHLEAALPEEPSGLLGHAERLFDTAVRHAWAREGADGFCYTLDWDDRPVVSQRMHWVVTEAIAAAHALHRRTGEDRYRDRTGLWWSYLRAHLADGSGNWRHELDTGNRPASTVWRGRPDVYHAYTVTALASGLHIPGFEIRAAVEGGRA